MAWMAKKWRRHLWGNRRQIVHDVDLKKIRVEVHDSCTMPLVTVIKPHTTAAARQGQFLIAAAWQNRQNETEWDFKDCNTARTWIYWWGYEMIFYDFFWFITYPSAFFGTRNNFFTERRRPANSRAFCCQRWTSMVLLENGVAHKLKGLRSLRGVENSTYEKGEKMQLQQIQQMQLLWIPTSKSLVSYCQMVSSEWCFTKLSKVLRLSCHSRPGVFHHPDQVSGQRWSMVKPCPQVSHGVSHSILRRGKTNTDIERDIEFEMSANLVDPNWDPNIHELIVFDLDLKGVSFLFACKERNNDN